MIRDKWIKGDPANGVSKDISEDIDISGWELIHNGVMVWDNSFNQSSCVFSLYKNGETKLGLAYERNNNSGMSITNGAENLWVEAEKQFEEIDFKIETYDRESFDRVTLKNGNASWTKFNKIVGIKPTV